MSQYRIQHSGFYALTLFSLTILLVLTGMFLAASHLINRYTVQFQEEIKLVVELSSGTSRDAADDLLTEIKEIEGVVAGSVEFVSKESALEEMREDMPEDIILEGMENPFTDMLRFSLAADHFDARHFKDLNEEIEAKKGVADLHHPGELFNPVFGLLKQVQVFGLILILVFILLCAILIHHIMRLNILSQRKQIRTMQLVGGHPSFIRKPYVILALKMAVAAWAAAGLICVGIAYFITGWTGGEISPVDVTIGSVILLILGAGVSVASTWVAVTRVIQQG